MSTPVRITGLTATADPALAAAGWIRRTVTTANRAEELKEVYTEIGFEVMVQPLEEETYADECVGCATTAVVVYTRRI